MPKIISKMKDDIEVYSQKSNFMENPVHLKHSYCGLYSVQCCTYIPLVPVLHKLIRKRTVHFLYLFRHLSVVVLLIPKIYKNLENFILTLMDLRELKMTSILGKNFILHRPYIGHGAI